MPEFHLRQTKVFAKWLSGLRDAKGKARIIARLDSAGLGNLGDTKSLGNDLFEMRVHAGPGYRIYFAHQHGTVILLLCAGGKTSQLRDIERARRMLRVIQEE